MKSQALLQVLIGGIVTVVAIMLFATIVNVGTALLSIGVKALLVLFLVAIVVRFMAVLDDKRKPF